MFHYTLLYSYYTLIMNAKNYFIKDLSPAQKQYCALAAFFKEGLPAKDIAKQYNYTLPAFYSLVRDFKNKLKNNPSEDPFFNRKKAGKKSNKERIEQMVILYRKKELSNTEILTALKSNGHKVSQSTIWRILKENGYDKLKRRTKNHKEEINKKYLS